MLMTHSAEVVIDDCSVQENERGRGKKEEILVVQLCFVVFIATWL